MIMGETEKRKLIVSMTSYPARIQYVPRVLESLKRQTHPADRIVLYLSVDQYPGKEKDLPEELRRMAEDGTAAIRWVRGDLKPHKKYFYAFQEFHSDLVLTADDDVVYPENMLECFLQTHEQHPGAVVAGRTHLITVTHDGFPRPYPQWIQRTTGFGDEPGMQLFAVGIGGVLYEPRLFPKETYLEEVIRETCLETDDLWLKAMEAAAGIPVVRTSLPELLPLIPGSQESSLFTANLLQGRNDENLAKIREWMKQYYGKDLLREQLNNRSYPRIEGEDELLSYINSDRKQMLTGISRAFRRQEERISSLETQVQSLNGTVRDLQESTSFRIGNRIVKMLSVFSGTKTKNTSGTVHQPNKNSKES